ncbi:MAG TPA: S41 family peptidase [Anaerolineales bacterium]|nr:S41 family peptidase [Anaerolineales bacterium]
MSSKGSRVLAGLSLGAILSLALLSTGLILGLVIPRAFPDSAIANWAKSPAAPRPTEGAPPVSNEVPEDTASRESLFAPFWEAWDIIHQEFVHQPLDDVALMRGAIRGMLEALGDEHTGYMDPDEYKQANIPLEGEYDGIGAWVDTDADLLTIIAPMPDSPAERAGLQPGDQIVGVDGEDVTDLSGRVVIHRVLGPAGTRVLLTIRREGELEAFDVEIVRETIPVPSVESRMLEDGVAYVRLFSFSEQTHRELRRALSDLLEEDPVGLIVDVRGNGGGFLTSAVDITSEFIQEGTILVERFGDDREEIYTADGRGLATEIPLVVLIDGGAASASEILAGAVQDLDRGLLVGETTFGKGSVQNWRALSGDSGAVRVTIALWYTPDGRSIQDVGLKPDVVVVLTEEDFEADRDPQLERAVEVLLDMLP